MALDIEAVKQLATDISELNERTLKLIGLPLDVMLVMVFRNSSQQGLVANGYMTQVGDHGQFIPTKETLKLWLDSYIARVIDAEQRAAAKQQPQQPPAAPAPEKPGLDQV